MVTTETFFYVKMLSMETLNEYLLARLKERGWSQNELAKRAGISHGTISNILSGNKGAGETSLKAIASAFHIPPEEIFRVAGILPQVPESTQQKEQLLHLFSLLPEKEKADLLKYIQIKLEMLSRSS
jgi:transcriptional regulator with XRE-family HTH domain